jgi:hypothetical protein
MQLWVQLGDTPLSATLQLVRRVDQNTTNSRTKFQLLAHAESLFIDRDAGLFKNAIAFGLYRDIVQGLWTPKVNQSNSEVQIWTCIFLVIF